MTTTNRDREKKVPVNWPRKGKKIFFPSGYDHTADVFKMTNFFYAIANLRYKIRPIKLEDFEIALKRPLVSRPELNELKSSCLLLSIKPTARFSSMPKKR